jgi:phosphate transport system substrate-binding protein
MLIRKHSFTRIAAFGLTAALVIAACGGDDEGDGGTDDTGASGLTGSVVVSGSSTVEPITSLVAELFSESNPDVDVRVDGPGTGDGFQLFCQGETDISDASRPIKDEEATACADAGIEYVELKVAIDGLSVITSPNNEAVTCLSFADLYALVGPESEGFETWADANELGAEVGGSGDYPDAPLDITAPGAESGTYDSFIEIALKDVAEARLEEGKIAEDQAETVRPDYSSQANDNQIISGIAGSDTSLGWVGFAFADENSDQVKSLEIDGGDGCVAPTTETIADGTYPLDRDLFIYVNKARIAEKPEVAAFVDLYMSEDGYTSVADADYVQLPEDDWQATIDAWTAAKG